MVNIAKESISLTKPYPKPDNTIKCIISKPEIIKQK